MNSEIFPKQNRLYLWSGLCCLYNQDTFHLYQIQNAQLENQSGLSEEETKTGATRREFLEQVSFITAGTALAVSLKSAKLPSGQVFYQEEGTAQVTIFINGRKITLELDPRISLLDVLRERLHLTGTKKGCDRGQCGACTVLADGKRINSCLKLAVMCEGMQVMTIEGLSKGDELHPMQASFIRHDAFQCGYCTPGQICSAVGLLKEGNAKTDAEIRELMSGNICRCGAYPNILDAIKEVQKS
jgi:xanthine dehydrogenase YagT iron-sulfur-binding subunit